MYSYKLKVHLDNKDVVIADCTSQAAIEAAARLMDINTPLSHSAEKVVNKILDISFLNGLKSII